MVYSVAQSVAIASRYDAERSDKSIVPRCRRRWVAFGTAAKRVVLCWINRWKKLRWRWCSRNGNTAFNLTILKTKTAMQYMRLGESGL
ncbi:hypothetical protein [Leptolyngbya ohadii]|uniref:hypothetical protein n=1 Tax=Leptolyngbya ohadii TaxID=1962290 RepID=UPI0015C5B894|nr:hypothetical protein [Leptolyngbya ohadii]